MIQIKDIDVFYGPSHVLKNISLNVKEGEIVTLIGANGAGKTTLIKTVSGLLSPRNGTIEFEGEIINKDDCSKIVSKGLVCVPEGRRIFKDMTVEENILLGSYIEKDKGAIQERFQQMMKRFPILQNRKDQPAGNLSGGEQQMLAIARALMSKPKVLLLDEPSMGLAPKMVNEIFSLIQEINKEGTTILLIEQNAKMSLKISDRAYIIETGKIVLEDCSKNLIESEQVQKIYLGG